MYRRTLKKFLFLIFNNEHTQIKRVDIIFCSDDYLLSLNKEFLNHNYYTDTLSFILSDSREPIIAELYLSIDRIQANSKTYRSIYQQELVRVIIHSCLHLCGYLDKPEENNKIMIRKQESYLKSWFVSRETQIGD